jgi:hypothetical protein
MSSWLARGRREGIWRHERDPRDRRVLGIAAFANQGDQTTPTAFVDGFKPVPLIGAVAVPPVPVLVFRVANRR